VGFKLVDGKGLREGWDSKDLLKNRRTQYGEFPAFRSSRGAPGLLVQDDSQEGIVDLKSAIMNSVIVVNET
jgi:hypothetical protein